MSNASDFIGQKIGGFELARVRGEGAQGVVYEAVHPTLRTKRAVKMLVRVTGVPDAVARFHQEALAMLRVKHPNVAEVFDLLELDGRPVMVMELLEGEDLATFLANRGGSLPVELAWRILAQIADALIAVHASGIIHRDLKPTNVFIVGGVDGPVVKLIDFGLTKLERGQAVVHSHQNLFVGTPSHSAPEQGSTPSAVDHRIDIFAFGVIAYEILTGREPFAGNGLHALVADKPNIPVPDPRIFAPGLAAATAAAIMACLAPDRDHRPATIQEAAVLIMMSIERGFEIARSVALTIAALHAAPKAAPFDSTLEVPVPSLAPVAISSERSTSSESRPGLALFMGGALISAFLVSGLWHVITRSTERRALPLVREADVPLTDATAIEVDANRAADAGPPIDAMSAEPRSQDAASPLIPVEAPHAEPRRRPADTRTPLQIADDEAWSRSPNWKLVRDNAMAALEIDPSSLMAAKLRVMSECKLGRIRDALEHVGDLPPATQHLLRSYCAHDAKRPLPSSRSATR